MPPSPDPVPTRQTLLSRLRDWRDDDSWQQFFDTYWKLIHGLAVKSGLSNADAQDVVQATLISIARRIPNFQYKPELGSFKSWLFLITRRRIADQLRKQARQPRPQDPSTSSGTSPIHQIPDPTSPDLAELWEREWQQRILEGALEEVRRHSDPRQFQIFHCHVIQEWPVKDVVAHFNITPNQVYLTKHRFTALLKTAAARIENNGGS